MCNDSVEEDFAESEPKLQETQQESDRKKDEQKIEDIDIKLSSFPQNEDLLLPLLQQNQVSSKDGTLWNYLLSLPSTTERQGKRSVFSTKPSTKKSILASVNDENDIFQEFGASEF